MREQIIHDMLVFGADHKWVKEHKGILLKQYVQQWVPAKNGQVIASDHDLLGLLSRLSRSAHTCMELITREPLRMAFCAFDDRRKPLLENELM